MNNKNNSGYPSTNGNSQSANWPAQQKKTNWPSKKPGQKSGGGRDNNPPR